jgi:hypothetical protein
LRADASNDSIHQMATSPPIRVSEARVPCPLCGGPIHPVAGRCKHCKQELTPFRSGRRQAAAQLPPLLGATNGHAAPENDRIPLFGSAASELHVPAGDRIARVASDAQLPIGAFPHEDAPSILPTRPGAAARSTAPRASIWRHWPIAVMSLAVVAILIALAVLFWSPGSSSHASKQPPPPAPERMETDPLPAQPQQAPMPAPPPTPIDPWAVPSAPHAQLSPGATPDVPSCVLRIQASACVRALSWCGNRSDDLELLCQDADVDLGRHTGAMKRCLEHIEQIDCAALSTEASLKDSIRDIRDCRDAMKHC